MNALVIITLVLVFIVGVVSAVNLYLLLKRSQAEPPAIDISDLKGEVGEVKRQVGEVIGSAGELSKQVGSLAQAVQNSLQGGENSVASRLGKVADGLSRVVEAQRRVEDLAKDVVSFKDLLKAPKARGGLGEVMLEQLLGNVLPPEHYEMQYSLGAERVDAIVKLPDGLVPIDSKFPLPSFERILSEETEEGKSRARRDFMKDVKARVDEIRTKYIKPEHGTVDFALMYIPAENVYYEAVNAEVGGESLLTYACSHKVIPVSPFTFYAYLVALAYGLRGLKVSEHAKVIREQLGALAKDLGAAQEDFGKLGTHIRNASNKYDEVGKHFTDFAFKLEQYGRLSGGESPVLPGDTAPPDA